MTLFEVDEAANRIRDEVDGDAYIIFGSTFDENLDGKIRVSVVATGMESEAKAMPTLLDSDGGATAIAGFLGNRPAPVVKMGSEIPPAGEAPAEEAEAPEMGEETPESPAEEATLPAAKPELEDAEAPAEPKIDADDAFIPSAPAEVEVESKVAEPFAAAAMTNGFGNRGLDTSTKASLFERVTGTGRAAKKRKEEPVIEAIGKTDPIVMAAPAEEPEKDEQIAGLNPEDQTPGQRDEDDLLDIPAFLPRHATVG